MFRKPGFLLLLVAVVFLSRLPFLWAGYGSEDDSWGLMLNAEEMARTGNYSFSRLPGHPVQEYILALMPEAGPFGMNLLSAIFSVAAVLLFAFSLRHFGVRYWLAWSLVYASIPIVWISSTYTIDYMWAVAFISGSYLALLHRNYALSGLLLGLAIGCRITSGAILPGFMLMCWLQEKKISRGLALLVFTTLLAGALCYLPSYLRYGMAFFDTYRLPYPSIPKVLYKASLGVWGFTGCLALAWLVWKKIGRGVPGKLPQPQVYGIFLVTTLYAIAFIVLPQKPAFWLPAIPFILLWIADQPFTRKEAAVAFSLFLLSPLLFGINLSSNERGSRHSRFALVKEVAGQEVFFDPFTGSLAIELSRRNNRQAYIERLLPAYRQLRGKHLVLCGWWTNQFTVNAQWTGLNPDVLIGEFYDRRQLDSLLAEGFTLWHLEEIDRANDERYSMEYTGKVSGKLDVK